MTIGLLVVCFGALLFAVLRWAFRSLPREEWQIIASVPVAKDESGLWRGINLTYYGLFVSISVVVSLGLMIVLLAAISVPLKMVFAMMFLLLGACLPSARIVARLVEKKKHTFTVAGAFFVGMLVVPGLIWATNWALGSWMDFRIPMIPTFAALAVCYGIGEGIGRLACITFGCCYGKPLHCCGPFVRRVLGAYPMVFSGRTKKIAYESGMDGQAVVPIQALTSVVYITVSLAGLLLFLNCRFVAALLLVMVVTQGWRVISETLRADYRGEGSLSAYQVMSLLAICYVVALTIFLPSSEVSSVHLNAGLAAMWDVPVILFLQIVWLLVFVYTGRSTVTSSTLSFHVLQDRV